MTTDLFKKNFSVSVIPLIVFVWGVIMLIFLDPFYSKSSDPEFAYLINGLNCALTKFNRIGHIAHPGTPFQLFCGIVIMITHLFSGKGEIAKDVFARPEHYMYAISFSLLLIQALLVFAVGIVGSKRKIPFFQIALLQSGVFFNDVLMWLLSRITPERFFLIVILLFILVYLKYGFESRSLRKFAFWSGVVMGLGMDTKFIFLPMLILPLLFIDSNKNRLIYIGTTILSFFIFLIPIVDKIDDYFEFLTSLFFHDGPYGSGASKVLNIQRMLENIYEIFKINPGLYFFIPTLVLMTILAIINRGKENFNKFTYLFPGFIVIFLIQIVMVSKQFANYYLVPMFTIYGFIFFSFSVFFSSVLKNKFQIILVSYLLPMLFIFLTVIKVKDDFALISGKKEQRDKIRRFVDHTITKDDFWFVEPTWESAPYIENALVYGLCWCGHREDYLPDLMAVNPNIITYEGTKDHVKLWRCIPVSLDSVLATGKNINVYSTPGRNADILIQMLQEAAIRNSVQLQLDTIYTNNETREKIIRAQGSKSSSTWQIGRVLFLDRTNKIQNFVSAIKNSPEWLDKVKEKAVTNHIPLDSMILLDAIWMVENEK